MILFLIFALFLFAVLCRQKPSWALGIILALLPTYLIRFRIGIPTTFLELLIVVFLFMVFLAATKEDWQKLIHLGRINWAVGLFALSGVIAVAASSNFLPALGQLKAFILEPILLFYASVLVLRSNHDQKVVLKYLFVSAAALSVFGIIQYFTYLFLPVRFWGTGEEITRIASVFEYPNAFALYLAPLIGFFAILWQKNYELFKYRIWFALGLAAMIIGLFLTFSRGAWLALLLTALLMSLTKVDAKKLLGIAGVVLIILAIPAARQRIGLGFSDPSTVAHLDLMQAGIVRVVKNPWLGNGLAGFPHALKEMNFSGEILNYPHNIFLNFWVELGLLGILAFALIIRFSLQVHGRRRTVITLAAGIYLVVLLLHGMVDAPYFKNDLAVLFWFMISLFYLD